MDAELKGPHGGKPKGSYVKGANGTTPRKTKKEAISRVPFWSYVVGALGELN
jgi:hypothetical protein